jgi:RimJ/RimL family protein N-acetyltransferase
MIELEPFIEEDFDRILSWIDTEEELIQFAGPMFNYPLTRNQLVGYISSDKRKPYKVRLKSTDNIIGHCELNFQKSIPRLSRILIGSKELRNKGIGQHIVIKLLNIIFNSIGSDRADLSVFDWNLNAIASYSKVGFKINKGAETTMVVGNKTWTAYNMVISKEDYLSSNQTSNNSCTS